MESGNGFESLHSCTRFCTCFKHHHASQDKGSFCLACTHKRIESGQVGTLVPAAVFGLQFGLQSVL